MVSVDKVSVFFGGFALFSDISFLINPRDRIGLVGKNGAGKTTLLNILCGRNMPSEGAVTMPKECTFGYLPQHMVHQDGKTVYDEAATAFAGLNSIKAKISQLNSELAQRTDYESDEYMELIHRLSDLNDRFSLLDGDSVEGHIERTLTGLGFLSSDMKRPTSQFSGGWRMRIELAKLLLQKPTVLLLDEPTNHLDIESIQWLEDFLKNYPGAVVLVSHDKAFLNNVTNRTIEIMLGRVHDYKVPYSQYIELRKERRETQQRAYENQQKQIKDTEAFIERFRYKATKSVQVQSRIKQLDKLDIIEVDEEDNSALNLKFPPSPRSGQVVVEAENLTLGYGNHMVLNQVEMLVERGEKVAFVGRNGEGKSTLVKAIRNELAAKSGFVKTGHNVKIGYFAQNQAELLDGEQTVFETIDRIAVGDVRTKIRSILAAFMFRGEDIDKKVKVLSGGEKSRLAMIKLLLEPVNLLLLDEPTNHLDMRSKEVLKSAIRDFDGTAIVVSHDRDFLDGLATKLYEFKQGGIKEHLGTVYEFLQKKKLAALNELERKKEQTRGSETEDKANKKDDYQARKDFNKRLSYAEKEVQKLEKEVFRLEELLESMGLQLANPEKMNDYHLFNEYDKVKNSLGHAMTAWEQAVEAYETIKNSNE